jgi:hypothetical protein
MAGPSIALRCALVAIALTTVAVLTGCSATPSSTPTAQPSKTSTPAKATPTPKPTPTFAALKYTCDSILPPVTLGVFKADEPKGFTLQSDYLQRMQNIGSNLVAFNTYGGILCQWSYPDASSNVDYAFSAITADQAATQQQTLTSTGYVGAPKDHGTLFANTDTADYPDEYLFLNGYWLQASTDKVMKLLVANVFVVPN